MWFALGSLPSSCGAAADELPEIGSLATASGLAFRLEVFRQGLCALDHVKGNNTLSSLNSAENKLDRLADQLGS
jgi:hypothetical protein